jgi:hypothetical protein
MVSTPHRLSTRLLSILAVVTEPSTTAMTKRATLDLATSRAPKFVLLKAVVTSNAVSAVTSDPTAAGRVKCSNKASVLLENTTRPKKSIMAEGTMTMTMTSAARIESMAPTTVTTTRASNSLPTPALIIAVASLAPPTTLSTKSVKMTAPATVKIVLVTATMALVAATKDPRKVMADKSMVAEDRSTDARKTTATVVRNKAMVVRNRAMVVVTRTRCLVASPMTMAKNEDTTVAVVVKTAMATKVVDGKLN